MPMTAFFALGFYSSSSGFALDVAGWAECWLVGAWGELGEAQITKETCKVTTT